MTETAILRRPAPMQGGHLAAAKERSQDTAYSHQQLIFAYHERTKHRLERYATGPEALDWSSQPEPFRTFAGANRIALPLSAEHPATPFSAVHQPGLIEPKELSLESIGLLLKLSLGLSAWKEYGPDRWAVRCNPSSGNLHPTEGYVISRSVPALEDGVYHYVSRDHILEQRCRTNPESRSESPARLLIGLSSIHWREAWKYGERSFRYCQLDVGHAVGALRYAAAALGWRLRLVEDVSWQQISRQLGLDRREDFSGAETEEAELLLEVIADGSENAPTYNANDPLEAISQSRIWTGRANVLDPHPMYDWPVVEEVAEASRPDEMKGESFSGELPSRKFMAPSEPASSLIQQRRSAQRFDNRYEMSSADFYQLLDALLPRFDSAPWDVWEFEPRLHPVFFVHRVEGLAPGLYVLIRNQTAESEMRAAMLDTFIWQTPVGCPPHLPFYQLIAAGCGQLAKTINCHQAIASDSAFAMGMLAEYEDILKAAPWRYRQLHWEAGLLGQVLYLEAEAVGLRGTGIGCYFDDTFHELLGLVGRTFQSLYHFTVGFPLTDARILTLPPYPER